MDYKEFKDMRNLFSQKILSLKQEQTEYGKKWAEDFKKEFEETYNIKSGTKVEVLVAIDNDEKFTDKYLPAFYNTVEFDGRSVMIRFNKIKNNGTMSKARAFSLFPDDKIISIKKI